MQDDTTEALKQKLLETLSTVEEWLTSGADLVKQETPIVIEEILWWGAAQASISLFVTLGLLTIASLVLRIGVTRGVVVNWDDYKDPMLFPYILIGGVSTLITGVVFLLLGLPNIYTLAKIYGAPRLYLLEWVQRFF